MPEPPVLASPAPLRRKFSVGVLRDYLALTKPPIVVLLLVTAAGGMFLAAQAVPSLLLMCLVGLGGALASGGANALNHFLDRDIDERMGRTRRRPVPGGRIAPWQALTFGVVLNVVAFAVLYLWVHWLAAALTLAATLFYALVYTQWLKRSTPHNIIIGGAAGAIPPVVGWVAVTGGLHLPALYLFTIVFFWTPPHFWALSLLLQEDYREAGVPMLPVVTSRRDTVLHILLYSLALVALTLMFGFTRAVGWVYLGGAAVLGLVFIALAWCLWRQDTRPRARTLYLYSLLYLALLFAVLMVDSVFHY
ncbi:MAG: protoheme IX farnesyltransferase [Dehalococcoidia bacterium]|nr:protoheme IX farnesyltransferase [Dehalococcoidia bacterium]MSQ16426.1 protoheme IX farnesyltransferase [Dehalococcoidia bacterium]